MPNFNLNRRYEPNSMLPVLEVLEDAEVIMHAVRYIVPGLIQTRQYANALLNSWDPPTVARQRAANRAENGRTLVAGTSVQLFTTEAALRNLHAIGGDVSVAREQLESLAELVDTEIGAGDTARVHLGIVPADVVKPLPVNLPHGFSNTTRFDIGRIDTADRSVVTGPDGYELDDASTDGDRITVVQHRLGYLARWESTAVTGDAAMQIIQDNLSLLPAA